jgi:UDP-2,4-diacetamido-2,4,6-trideoxy-beta-L-altropyranose hydrolase
VERKRGFDAVDRQLVENPRVIAPVVFVADAGKDAGLGHISRSSAVAVALRCRGITVRCFAHGISEPFERDGLEWAPLSDQELAAREGDVIVVDTYRVATERLSEAASSNRLVVMHDLGSVPAGAALVVTVAGRPSSVDAPRLTGPEYASLRPMFWGLPTRTPNASVRRILVAVGSGQFAAVGSDIAAELARAIPDAHVAVVLGPHSSIDSAHNVEVLDVPDSLLEPLLQADLAVTAAGQTMLEAAASGTPSIALVLADNQRAQAKLLGDAGAACVVDSPTTSKVATAVAALLHDRPAREQLSASAQRLVDGYGALRVAFAIARLHRGA